jgi:hypothetical protein
MFVIGLLSMLLAAGFGGWLAWENRNAIVHVHVGTVVWTGHLYAVFIFGALVACWFLLGAAFIQCRIAERRRARLGLQARRTQEPRRPVRRPQRIPAARSAPGRPAAAGAGPRAASPG